VKGEVWLKRHRLFESSEYLVAPGKCHCHGRKTIGVYGTGGAGGESRGWKGTAQNSRDVMGIHWMNRWELAQAIPPVYTQWVGAQLLDALEAA
jgi:DNA (cytosine-5)-methyltransferase 1